VEDAPGYGVDLVVFDVLEFLAIFVNCLVRDTWVSFKMCTKLLNDTTVYKELEVGFLVHVSFFWAPAELLVGGFDTINLWLRIQSEQFVGIHQSQDLS